MIRPIAELHKGKTKIDLTGPNGNAYYLLAVAHDLCKQLHKLWRPIEEDMKSGDYEHLLFVFDREFDEYVDLYR